MDYKKYDDNELIYLIKMNNESAWEILVEKYKKFIHMKIYEYNLDNHEDCFQEGIISLYNAARVFDNNFNKSFMKYYENILIHKLLDIKRIQERESEFYTYDMDLDNCLLLKEDSMTFNDDLLKNSELLISKLTSMEKIVYEDYYINNLSIKDISIKNNMKVKNIYYTIYRIKGKIKKYMIK